MDIFRTATTKLDNRKLNDYIKRLMLAKDLNDEDYRTFIDTMREDYMLDKRITYFNVETDLLLCKISLKDPVILRSIRLVANLINGARFQQNMTIEQIRQSYVELVYCQFNISRSVHDSFVKIKNEADINKTIETYAEMMTIMLNTWMDAYISSEHYDEANDNDPLFRELINKFRKCESVNSVQKHICVVEYARLKKEGYIK